MIRSDPPLGKASFLHGEMIAAKLGFLLERQIKEKVDAVSWERNDRGVKQVVAREEETTYHAAL